jgi:hypothetical protein
LGRPKGIIAWNPGRKWWGGPPVRPTRYSRSYRGVSVPSGFGRWRWA